MAETKIEWSDMVWNPVTGCIKVSPGCKHCYAERLFSRVYPGRAFTNVQCHPERLEAPLHWKKPRRVFVNSMSDLFHEDVPNDFIAEVFSVMARCQQHTFQVLTKRPARMLAWITSDCIDDTPHDEWPLPNVWLGVSVEDQSTADERIPLLLKTPAAVRFISAEPLLRRIDLCEYLGMWWNQTMGCFEATGSAFNIKGREGHAKPGLGWVIAGGESGPKARPSHPDWFRSLRDQCVAAGVPFFFKQWGEWAPNCLCKTIWEHKTVKRPEPGKLGVMFRCGKRNAGRLLDGRTWDQYPALGPQHSALTP